MTLDGKTALVTGAAGGLGRALATAFAERGAQLALADLDEAGLAETRRLAAAAALGARHITCHRLDVADRAAVAALPATLRAEHGGLDCLVNNAGVALGGRFEEVDEADFDWLFAINFFGVVQMTRACLPMLHESAEARIVNVSSVFGLIAPPGQAAYAASKYAVRGFSDALRHELAGTRIGVTTVHPGGIATSIAASARAPRGAAPDEVARQKQAFAKALRLAPRTAAETILRGIERRRARIVVGRDAKIAAAIERLLPVSYWSVLERLASR